jgi:26S proteasome regulatory subunit N2
MLTDTKPSEPKTLLELKVKQVTTAPAAAPETLEDRVNDAYRERDGDAALGAGGAAAAAGVLTAVDEDEEGGEDAELPGGFEYYSEDEGE